MNSHAQNTTAFQPTVSVTVIEQLLVTNRGLSALPSANNCQGQLENSQSITVLYKINMTAQNDRDVWL